MASRSEILRVFSDLLLGNDESDHIPYIPFPDNPKTINVEGVEVFEYLSPEFMKKRLLWLSHHIELGEFEAVVVNIQGGAYLYEQLSYFQKASWDPIEIEYHRTETGVEKVTPVPNELYDKRILVIEDVGDRCKTLEAILEDAPYATFAVVVKKRDVPEQVQVPHVIHAVETDNVWLGGVGMNFGFQGYDRDFPRNYGGIVVMKESISPLQQTP